MEVSKYKNCHLVLSYKRNVRWNSAMEIWILRNYEENKRHTLEN